ncbi:hypothetical protein PSTT_06535, partial [Puccinia striiformis]
MTPQPLAHNPELASSTDASKNRDNELRHPTSAVTSQPEKEANPSLGEIGKPSTHPQGTSYLTSGRTSNVLHLDTADANELEIYLNRIGTKLSVQDEQVLDKFYSAFPVSNKQFNTRVHATAKDLELLLKWKDANAVTHARILVVWCLKWMGGGDLLGGKDFPPLQSSDSIKKNLKTIDFFEKDSDVIADVIAKAPFEQWKAYLGPEEYKSRIEILKTMSNLKNLHRIPADTIRDWIEQGLDVNRMLKVVDYTLEHGFPDLASMGSTELKTAKKLFLKKNTYGIDWSKSLEHQELLKTPQGKEYLDIRQNLKDLVSPPQQPSTVPSPEFEGSPLTPIIQNQRSFTEPVAVLDRPASYPGYSTRMPLYDSLKQRFMRLFNVNTEGPRALSSPRPQPSISQDGHLTEGLLNGVILDHGLSASSKLDSGTASMTPQPLARNPEVASSIDASKTVDHELRHTSSMVTSQPERGTHSILGDIGKTSTHPPETSYWGKLTNSWDHLKSYLPSGRTRTVLHFSKADASLLESYLKLNGAKLSVQDKQVLDMYYSAFSVSNKAFNIRIQPATENFKLLLEREEANHDTYGIFRNFFSEVLSERELFRRENALKIQRTQFWIMSGWDKQVKAMSQDSGYSASEFARFGNVVGAPVFPPALESSILIKRTPEMIEFLEKDSSGLRKQWKTYLEQTREFDSRLQILKTMSNLKNPDRITSDKIHDWIAQGLDVNRMLKIVDYTLQNELSTLSSLGTAEYAAAKELFLGRNQYQVNWSKSLEHQELSQTPQGEKYLHFCTELETLAARPRQSSIAEIPSSQLEKETHPSLVNISLGDTLANSRTHLKSHLPSGWTSPLLRFSNADASKLELYLRFTGIRLTDKQKQYLDKLYSALSVSEKESNTRVHATAEEFELLSKWKQTDPVTHGIIRTFFTRVLLERELVRRESVLNLQQAKLQIISGWSEQVESISQDSGRSVPEVAGWGDLLGGKVFPPPLQSPNSIKKSLKAIGYFEKDSDVIAKAPFEQWKAYLGPEEYKSRIEILKTMSNLKTPVRIAPNKIRDWIEQGLDVNRMLKVVDYTLEHELPDLAYLGNKQYNTAKELFLGRNSYEVDWSKSLEHQELSRTPEGPKYLDFRTELETLAARPRKSTIAGISSPTLNHLESLIQNLSQQKFTPNKDLPLKELKRKSNAGKPTFFDVLGTNQDSTGFSLSRVGQEPRAMMQEDIQPIEPLNLDKIDAIADRLMHLANELLESKLSQASSSSGTMAPSEGLEGNLFNEPESDQNLILLAAPLFARLKFINRNSSSMVSNFKSQTQKVRNQVDQIHLDLQNLVYERRHLEKEIKKCQEFESEYQNISIHSLEEYFERNPEDKREEPDVIDPHELMIKRLKFELSERKRFEAEKKELLQKKLKLSKENDEKKSKLDELEKQLDRFVVSAKEIQSKMANQICAQHLKSPGNDPHAAPGFQNSFTTPFFAQFPLRNSLPMESGVLTKFTASSGRSFKGQSHASDLTNGLTTSAHELADTKSVGMSPDTQAGNVKNLDDTLPTPWGNHRSLKPIDWSQPRTLASKSPSSQSSKSQEVSLSDEWKHTSPKAASPKENPLAPTSPTSEYAKQIHSLYRQVLSAIEKPQARLQKTKYWQKLTTYADEMKTHPLFDWEPVVLHFNPDDETKLTKFLTRAGQNLIPRQASFEQPSQPRIRNSTQGGRKRTSSLVASSVIILKRYCLKGRLSEERVFYRYNGNSFESSRAGRRRWLLSAKLLESDRGKVFPLSFDHSNFKESLAKLKSLNREKPRIASQWEQYLGQEEYESRIGLLKTMSRMKDPNRIPVQTIAGWRAQGLDVDRMLKIVDYTPNGRQIGDEAHQFADFHFTNPAERKSAKNLFLSDNLYGIPWLKSLEHFQLLQNSPETKLKYLNFHSKLQLPDHSAPPPPLILPAEPVLPSQPM